MRSLEEKIKDAEKKFISDNKRAANYLALSVYGYAALKSEVATRLNQSDIEYAQDMNNYEGLKVLVSQDSDFEDFILL